MRFQLSGVFALIVVLATSLNIANADDYGRNGSFPGWAYPAVEKAVADMRGRAPEIDLQDCIIRVYQFSSNLVSVAFYDKDTYSERLDSTDSELYSVTFAIGGLRIVSRWPE